jgi:DNA repair photolyase
VKLLGALSSDREHSAGQSELADEGFEHACQSIRRISIAATEHARDAAQREKRRVEIRILQWRRHNGHLWRPVVTVRAKQSAHAAAMHRVGQGCEIRRTTQKQELRPSDDNTEQTGPTKWKGDPTNW